MSGSTRFTGFFPYPQAWVLPVPSEDELQRARSLILHDAVKYTESDYVLRVSRDGMILLHINEWERHIDEVKQSWSGDLVSAQSYDTSWRDYLMHMNALYFLLECAMHSPAKRNIYIFWYSELSMTDIRRVTYDEEDQAKSQTTYGSHKMADLDRFGDTAAIKPPEFTVEPAVFEDLKDLYQEVFANNLIEQIAWITKAVSALKLRNYNTSLLWSFIWIEMHVAWLWE